jgi:PAS domain S-box-containing protein
MAEELRKTGISVVGDLPWGTHFCTFYETKQDLLDILVPYFKTGLESKEFCLWIISKSELITTEEAKEALGEAVSDLDRYLAEGRIEIVSHDQWFLKNGAFDFHRVAYGFKEKLDEALANGYAGLRINGSPAWIQAQDANVLREFEGEADHFFANEHIIASCTYPLEDSRTEFLLDVARNHQFTIARRHGKWDVLETPQLIQAKQEIQRLNEDLEQRVVERTRELAAANEELRKEIAERRQAEDALRQSEDHLRLVIDTIPTMAWSLRPDGVVDFLNQPWIDYTGLSLEDYVKDPTGPIHPEDIPRVIERWLVEKAIGEPYEDEMRLRRADGVYRWFLVRTAPLRDQEGNLVKWYGVSIDIEDRKQAEEKLKHKEVQLAQAQRLAHIGSWDWDLRTNVVTWSDELYHIFGLQPGTISVAGEVDRYIHPDDLALGWDTVKRAIASKEPYDYYHRILRPDGTERIARSRGSIMTDERGEPVKVFGATQDVTDLKRAEENLKATSEQLRALSASLQSAREQESTRIAREIHDELGGTLTSLRWDLEEVRDVISEASASSQLAPLRSKIEVMIALTETILNTVRRLASELRPMALDELGLVEAIEWQALQFQTRTGLAVEYQCTLEKVDLNSEQSTAVFRILQEALTNILRHAQATKVAITMKQESGELFLSIKDNGRGITESEKSDAHSLGLLGMRERAHLIGAQIDITGIEGKGTQVAMRIPISESSERRKKV